MPASKKQHHKLNWYRPLGNVALWAAGGAAYLVLLAGAGWLATTAAKHGPAATAFVAVLGTTWVNLVAFAAIADHFGN